MRYRRGIAWTAIQVSGKDNQSAVANPKILLMPEKMDEMNISLNQAWRDSQRQLDQAAMESEI